MKYFLPVFFSLSVCVEATGQTRDYPFYQLYQLDSIGHAPSTTRHFGKLYFDFLTLVEKELERADSTTKRLLRRFEMVFAQFYIDACHAYAKQDKIPLKAWSMYFSDSTLQPIQYLLLGANAHLNGGLAEAINSSYTPAEWRYLEKRYSLFNKCLNKTLRQVYQQAISSNKRAKLLSVLSLGMDRPVSQYYLYKWRKRQMRLTGYLFNGSPGYEALLQKINRKKDRIDKLVLEQF